MSDDKTTGRRSSHRGRAEGPLPALRRGALFSGFWRWRRAAASAASTIPSPMPATAGGFVMLIIGFIVVGLALWMEVTMNPPLWVHFILWIPLTRALPAGAAADQGRADHAAIRQQGGRGPLDRPNERGGRRHRLPRSGYRGLRLSWRGIAVRILIGLGTWQVQRLQWKEALIATIAERIAGRAAAACRGRAAFTADRRRRLSPVTCDRRRSSTTASGISSRPGGAQSGFYVYTPLKLADGRVVFVNRGFVPYDLKDPANAAAGRGWRRRSTVTGLARNPLPGKPSIDAARQRPGQEHLLLEGSATRWRQPPASAPVAASCRSSSTPERGPIPADCRSAASPSSTCPTTTCNMPSPGTGWRPALAGVMGMALLRRRLASAS